MNYFLAHIPKVDFTQINEIRKKFDPNFRYIDPHIAVVFPVDSTIGESYLIDHIQSVTKNATSFPISLSGLEKSWDHYLYLTVRKGAEKIISLHDKLYSGILKKYWFKDIPYKPHITLGFFADRQAKFDKSDIQDINVNTTYFDNALLMAKVFNFNISVEFDNLSLVKRQDKQSPAVIIKEFPLLSI